MAEDNDSPSSPTDALVPILVVGALLTVCFLCWRKEILAFYRAFAERQREKSSRRSGSRRGGEEEELLPRSSSSKKSSSFHSISWSNRMNIEINGKAVEIVNPDPAELLSTYIRDKLCLKGTKLGCEEGGCGACSIVLQDPRNNNLIKAVNSCLRLLCANDGQIITTVEGIGSLEKGLSEEQRSIVEHNGTQCGYCTPGWVTAMHALKEQSANDNKVLTPSDIDSYFDGNICRCTGYRPIMKAFHSICGNDGKSQIQQLCGNPDARANPSMCNTGKDMEDMTGDCEHPHPQSASKTTLTINRSKKTNTSFVSQPLQPLHFFNPASGKRYLRPVNFDQLCACLKEFNSSSNYGTVKLLGGNTSVGVTKYLNNSAPFYYADEYLTAIDVNRVPELNVKSFDNQLCKLKIGAAVTINESIELLNQYSSSKDKSNAVDHHSTFSVTANHFHRIANTQVRNAATWAGNLMIFLQYKDFPSDAVLALTNASAVLQISDTDGNVFDLPMHQFLTFSFEQFQSRGLFIVSLTIVETSSGSTVTETFKVAQREHNSHAYVDGAFNFQLSSQVHHSKLYKASAPISSSARVVFGGVGKTIFIASRTEQALTNAPLNAQTLGLALNALQQDLMAVGVNTSSDNVDFLISVMQTNLYRAFLRCYKLSDLPPNVVSALLPWTKPSSRGVEVFPVNRFDQPQLNPVGRPVRKLEGPIQATGEAIYPSDEVLAPNGYQAEIVFSTQCNVELLSIDASLALEVSGVVAVYTAKDIPGNNSIGNGNSLFVTIGSIVPCVGAPLAVIVASTEEIATKAASLVKVQYRSKSSNPIVNLQESIAAKAFYTDIDPSMSTLAIGDAPAAMAAAAYRAKGRVAAGGQYHFYMETQTATAQIIDGSVVQVVCGTQDPTNFQNQIAGVLGLPSNKVVVQCQRVGGAFGGKLSGGLFVSTAAALCAKKLNCPVRIFNSRSWDMTMQGGREEWIADYEVGFNADGMIQSMILQYYIDAGSALNDTIGALIMGMLWADNAYFIPNFLANANVCFTNTPSRTSMRAPGVVQSCLITESVVERVAVELNLPLATIQQRNFIKNGEVTINNQPIVDCRMQDVWTKLMNRSHYVDRVNRVNTFNSQNLWRKRGLACCPVKYGMGWSGYNAGIRLSVRSADGYVVITHNGVEIGQGINTKVVQAVAMALDIDLKLIRVERTSTAAVTNGGCTGGSGTSEVVVQAALNACKTLNDRLAPFRSKRGLSKKVNSAKTEEWVALLQSLPYDVSLNVEGWYSPNENPNQQIFQYFVYAACVTEVELNVLSGEVHVLASEIVYDCGRSLNPAVDIGQIEGGLVMGIGYFFQEKVQYAEGTGTLKTVGTWEYKPPMAQDIPSVLNVTLIANDFNKDGILGSKAVGEPPYIVSNSAFFALKHAISSARGDAGVKGHFDLAVPATVDVRQSASLVSPGRFIMPC